MSSSSEDSGAEHNDNEVVPLPFVADSIMQEPVINDEQETSKSSSKPGQKRKHALLVKDRFKKPLTSKLLPVQSAESSVESASASHSVFVDSTPFATLNTPVSPTQSVSDIRCA